MNEEPDWSQLKGIDTDGVEICNDLNRLAQGQLNDDEDQVTELLCDLVRDGSPSTAGYAAIPFLIRNSTNDLIPLKARLQMMHAACLILGLSSSPAAPPIPHALIENFCEEVTHQALQRLFHLASQDELNSIDVICITSAALLIKDRRDAYDYLTQML